MKDRILSTQRWIEHLVSEREGAGDLFAASFLLSVNQSMNCVASRARRSSSSHCSRSWSRFSAFATAVSLSARTLKNKSLIIYTGVD
jgi:sugar/nucleoside kinase (ribokinase family)